MKAELAMEEGNILEKINAGHTAYRTMQLMENQDKAREITAKTRAGQGDVVMFAGCKDEQTSADTQAAGIGSTG